MRYWKLLLIATMLATAVSAVRAEELKYDLLVLDLSEQGVSEPTGVGVFMADAVARALLVNSHLGIYRHSATYRDLYYDSTGTFTPERVRESNFVSEMDLLLTGNILHYESGIHLSLNLINPENGKLTDMIQYWINKKDPETIKEELDEHLGELLNSAFQPIGRILSKEKLKQDGEKIYLLNVIFSSLTEDLMVGNHIELFKYTGKPIKDPLRKLHLYQKTEVLGEAVITQILQNNVVEARVSGENSKKVYGQVRESYLARVRN